MGVSPASDGQDAHPTDGDPLYFGEVLNYNLRPLKNSNVAWELVSHDLNPPEAGGSPYFQKMIAEDKTKRRKLITVIGVNYIELLVLDLLSKAFEVYKKRDFGEKNFQVSVLEKTYATAGIVLAVLGLEAYRNMIFYSEKRKVNRDVASDLSQIVKDKVHEFPASFQNILTEVFVIRDVIVHNHIYEVEVFYDKEWKMLKHNQKLLEDYGDKKRRSSGIVIEKTRKTKLLGFNVQPAKIGFEDLNTLLFILDLFVGVYQRTFGDRHVPFHLTYELNNHCEDNLSKLLAYYYEQIPNQKYKDKLNTVIKSLKNHYSKFLAKEIMIVSGKEEYLFDKEYVTTNFCPKCHAFGFHKPNSVTSCSKCKFKIKIGDM